MKKKYIQPACEVVEIKIESNLLQDSVQDVNGNANLSGGGPGNVNERARQSLRNDWDDWDEWE